MASAVNGQATHSALHGLEGEAQLPGFQRPELGPET